MAGRRKEAVMCLLDASSSMSGLVGGPPVERTDTGSLERMSRFDMAKECIVSLMAQKCIDNPKGAELAVIAYGTQGTENVLVETCGQEYEHITAVNMFQKPTADMVKSVRELETSDLEGDFIAGLITAVHYMVDYTQVDKKERSMYIFTDARTRITEVEGIEPVLEKLNQCNVKVTIVIFDMLTKGDDVEPDKTIPDGMDAEARGDKVENEEFLRSVGQNMTAGGSVRDGRGFYLETMHLRKHTNSQNRNMAIEITSDLLINVQMSALTSLERPPSLTKREKNYVQGDQGKVELERSYILGPHEGGDPYGRQEGTEIALHERLVGYKYGTETVPLDEIQDVDGLKIKSDKASVKVLSFPLLEDIPRHYALGKVSAVKPPSKDDGSATVALSALAKALEAEKRVAHVRLVRMKDAEPELGMLVPPVPGTLPHPCLVYVRLPFSDDVRGWRFRPLSKMPEAMQPDKEQLQAADDLIDSLMIKPDPVTGRSLKLVPNPGIAAAWRAILNKAVNPDQPLPSPSEMPPTLQPDPELLKTASKALKQFHQLFPMKKIEQKSRKEQRTWGEVEEDESEAVERDAKRQKTEGVVEEVGETPMEVMAPGAQVEREGSCRRHLVPTPSVVRFRELIKAGEHTEQALKLMTELVDASIVTGLEGNRAFMRKAVEYLQALREGAIEVGAKGSHAYNTLLVRLKREHSKGRGVEFWEQVKRAAHALRPISSSEAEGRLPETVAAEFFEREDDAEAEEVAPPSPDKADEEDELDEIE